jgi:hypothetical protein
MKRFLLYIALLMLLFTCTAKAQSTFKNPYRGAKHTYTATVTDTGAPNGVRWYVATDVNGTKANYGEEYSFNTIGYNATYNALVGFGVYSVEITWGAEMVIGQKYYVFIEVDDDQSLCTNRMALEITASANFNALAMDVTGSDNPSTVDPNAADEDIEEETCPDDVINPIWNGTSQTDIGVSEIMFRIDREYSLNAWQFQYTVTEASNQPFEVKNIRFVHGTDPDLYNGPNSTGTIFAGTTQNYVLAYVQITNQMGKTLNIEMNLITKNSLTKDSSNLLDSKAADNKADHLIKPMPIISGFGGN